MEAVRNWTKGFLSCTLFWQTFCNQQHIPLQFMWMSVFRCVGIANQRVQHHEKQHRSLTRLAGQRIGNIGGHICSTPCASVGFLTTCYLIYFTVPYRYAPKISSHLTVDILKLWNVLSFKTSKASWGEIGSISLSSFLLLYFCNQTFFFSFTMSRTSQALTGRKYLKFFYCM